MAKKKKSTKKSTKKSRKAREQGEENPSVDEQLDEVFNEAWDEVDPKSFDELPDATYPTRIIAAMLNNAQSSGRFQCSWEMLVLTGDFKGRHIFKHDGLDTEDGLGYFQGDLAKLGYEKPKSKKKLLALLEEIVDAPTYVSMRLSTRKRKTEEGVQEFQNKRFVKALDSDEVEDDFDEEELTSSMEAASLEGSSGSAKESGDGESSWTKGDEVKVKIDKVFYPGKIKTINEGDDTALVAFEDGDNLDIPFDDLNEPEEAEKSNAGEETLEKGDRVSAEIDDKTYEGKIKKVAKDKATVLFDDGDKQVIPLDELTKLDEDKDKDKKEGEGGCSLVKTKFSSADRRALVKLAKTDDFDLDDYETKAQALCEIADYHGLEGEHKTPTALIKTIKEAIDEEE